MTTELCQKLVWKLDAIIATLEQAVVIGGRTPKEGEACDLLKDARLKLIEDLETQPTENRCECCHKPTANVAEHRTGAKYDPTAQKETVVPYTMPLYCDDCLAFMAML